MGVVEQFLGFGGRVFKRKKPDFLSYCSRGGCRGRPGRIGSRWIGAGPVFSVPGVSCVRDPAIRLVCARMARVGNKGDIFIMYFIQ